MPDDVTVAVKVKYVVDETDASAGLTGVAEGVTVGVIESGIPDMLI